MSISSAFERETVEADGCRVALLRGGTGETLLYLHGAEGDGTAAPFLDTLAETHEVLAPEHPGFGGSDEPEWLDNIHDVAYFYLDLLEILHLDDVHLVGFSLGGWIALEMAVRSTARMRSLTLVSAAGIHVPGLPTGDLFAWSPEETLRRSYADPALVDRALEALPADIEGDDVFLKNRSTLARLAWEPRLHDPHLHKWLHRIDVPTRIVWGEDDQVLSAGYAKELAGRIPGAEATVLPRCGHLVPAEKPAELAQVIHDHARQVSR